MSEIEETKRLREKLEEDIGRFSEMYAILGTDKSIREHAIEWLDRQAAITERECANKYVNTWTEGSVAWILRQYEDEKLMRDVDCDMHVLLETEELEDRISELQEQVVVSDETCEFFAEKCEAEKERCAELQAKVDGLENEKAGLRAALDAIREALGR